jgi:hypothetical protein
MIISLIISLGNLKLRESNWLLITTCWSIHQCVVRFHNSVCQFINKLSHYLQISLTDHFSLPYSIQCSQYITGLNELLFPMALFTQSRNLCSHISSNNKRNSCFSNSDENLKIFLKNNKFLFQIVLLDKCNRFLKVKSHIGGGEFISSKTLWTARFTYSCFTYSCKLGCAMATWKTCGKYCHEINSLL